MTELFLIVGEVVNCGVPRGLHLFGVAAKEDEAKAKAEHVIETQQPATYLRDGRPRILKLQCEEVPL